MDKIYSIWFNELTMSCYAKKQLIEEVKSFKEIYKGNEKQYKEWGLTEEGSYRLVQGKDRIKNAEIILRKCEKEQIEVIDYLDNNYAIPLKEIPDPPMVLYLKGNKYCLTKPMIAVVGSRKCSEYGEQMAIKIASELAERGLCITSGMAIGIDSAAHLGALQRGYSVGILGTSPNICYPSCNEQLYQELIYKGCVVSEYPPDTVAKPYYFPRRNRIISGMVYATVVIEAAIKSGSLITAQLAMGYNREVYALPGNVNSFLSEGTNDLIRKGAKCIVCAENIIEDLPNGVCIKSEEIKKNRDKLNNELAQEVRIVYANVSQEPILFEKIIESTQLSGERVNTSLFQLELKGLIKRLPGERYVRI